MSPQRVDNSLCGITELFSRLMRILPHSLAAAMLPDLRFGLQAFASLDGQFWSVEVCCWYGWQPRPLRRAMR
ncbi:benzoate/H(+) symporter BenE family transporter [Escherichia coli]